MDTNALINRLTRVVRFDATVYREIAGDQNAMGQAIVVVLAASVLNAVGAVRAGLLFAVIALVAGVIAFVLYSAVAAGVSRAMFQGKTDFQEMARTLGFTYVWNALGLLGLVPLLGGIIGFIAWIAAIVSGVLALREAAEFDTGKAVITMIISGIVAFGIYFCTVGPLAVFLGLAQAAAQR